MSELLFQLAGALALLAVIGLALAAFHDWAYNRGHEDGYATGNFATDTWLLKAEVEVDEVRQQIWREESEP